MRKLKLDRILGLICMPVVTGMLFGAYICYSVYTDLINTIDSQVIQSVDIEYGRPVIWIEDLFLEEDARGMGLGERLFDFVKEKYPDHIHRLEVEDTNLHAIRLYKKSGFTTLPYAEMIREPEHK